MTNRPVRVLFVCVENSNRSQMAEAFARMHGGENIESFSAGSRPSGRVNPKAIEAMCEVGYDLTTHASKALADLPAIEFDAVIGMGCGDQGCPLVKAKRHEEWDIPDPKILPPEQFREIRELIRRKVQTLLAELSTSDPTPFVSRPEPTEYASPYRAYIALVPDGDFIAFLTTQLQDALVFLHGVKEADASVPHPPYTWTIKQALGHVIDAERIFGIRALRFARNDPTPLPTFDENEYVRRANFNDRTVRDLAEEFDLVRRSHLSLFRHLDEEAWLRAGVASGYSVTVRALAYIIAGHAEHHLRILRKRMSLCGR
jgi:arsenate reductase (thioredoxin)